MVKLHSDQATDHLVIQIQLMDILVILTKFNVVIDTFWRKSTLLEIPKLGNKY